jgi:hypothetical protein
METKKLDDWMKDLRAGTIAIPEEGVKWLCDQVRLYF